MALSWTYYIFVEPKQDALTVVLSDTGKCLRVQSPHQKTLGRLTYIPRSQYACYNAGDSWSTRASNYQAFERQIVVTWGSGEEQENRTISPQRPTISCYVPWYLGGKIPYHDKRRNAEDLLVYRSLNVQIPLWSLHQHPHCKPLSWTKGDETKWHCTSAQCWW